GVWTTDFNLYEHGETFRFFRDQNGNSCLDELDKKPIEPISQSQQRGLNEQIFLWEPAGRALSEANDDAPNFRSASLWFPGPLLAPRDFGRTGPGQGGQ